MDFDFSRLRRSDWIIGISSIVFFISLVGLNWLAATETSGGAGTEEGSKVSISIADTGWKAFTSFRWLWLITIIVALLMVGMTLVQKKIKLPTQRGVVVMILGALSAVFIAYRIVHHPSFNVAGVSASGHGISLAFGIFIGFIASLGVTYGGYLAMRDEGGSLQDVRAQASAGVSRLSTSVAAPKAQADGSQPLPPASTQDPAPAPAQVQASPPAGWHKRSTDPTQERYWDGEQWTDQVRPTVQ